MGRRLEPNCPRTHIQRFLDASSRVVEEGEAGLRGNVQVRVGKHSVLRRLPLGVGDP